MEAYSGSQARDFINGTNSGTPTGPYRQSYQYSQFNQLTQQTARVWSDNQTTTNFFVNNRNQSLIYDAAGFVTNIDDTAYVRDAAGRQVRADGDDSHGAYAFDGDGRLLKTFLSYPSLHGHVIVKMIYYVNSTVLGGLAVAELDSSGQKNKRNVYAGGRKLAEEANGYVSWSHYEPVTG